MVQKLYALAIFAATLPAVASEITIRSSGADTTIITIGDDKDAVVSREQEHMGACGVGRCSPTELREADDAMNKTYSQLMSRLSSPNANQLRDRQRGWISDRDKECGVTYTGSDREKWLGHLVSDDKRAYCVMRTTRERTTELTRQLRSLSNVTFVAGGHAINGKSQQALARDYWTWTRNFPGNARPFDDMSGRSCGQRQASTAWFLTGSNANVPVQRQCEVPAGVPVVIPALSLLLQTEAESKTECAELVSMARNQMENPPEFHFTVDGIDYKEALRRVNSGCFKLKDVQDGVERTAVGDGLWAFLEPLPPGEHTVTFGGRFRDGFSQNVTYRLNVRSGCTLPLTQGEAEVVAIGKYSGLRPEAIQLGSSGHEVRSTPVVVNRPGKPTVLVLMAYDPTWWQVALTPGTQLKGVVLAGYHTQAVTGISRQVPLLKAVHEELGTCPYFYAYKAGSELDRAIQRIESITHQPLKEMITEPVGGRFIVGKNDFDEGRLLVTSDYVIEDFPVKRGLPAGQAGIELLVKEGKLRKAAQADIDEWVNVASAKYRKLNPGLKVSHHMHAGMTYVVLGPVTLPTGMYGAHMRAFLIPRGTAKPKDHGSHNTYYYLENGTCEGPPCMHE